MGQNIPNQPEQGYGRKAILVILVIIIVFVAISTGVATATKTISPFVSGIIVAVTFLISSFLALLSANFQQEL